MVKRLISWMRNEEKLYVFNYKINDKKQPQYFPSSGNHFEPFGAIWVLVWVILESQSTVSALNLTGRGSWGHFQSIVKKRLFDHGGKGAIEEERKKEGNGKWAEREGESGGEVGGEERKRKWRRKKNKKARS
jgi:hypothetical protein